MIIWRQGCRQIVATRWDDGSVYITEEERFEVDGDWQLNHEPGVELNAEAAESLVKFINDSATGLQC